MYGQKVHLTCQQMWIKVHLDTNLCICVTLMMSWMMIFKRLNLMKLRRSGFRGVKRLCFTFVTFETWSLFQVLMISEMEKHVTLVVMKRGANRSMMWWQNCNIHMCTASNPEYEESEWGQLEVIGGGRKRAMAGFNLIILKSITTNMEAARVKSWPASRELNASGR